jgi:hypothetical protein
MTKVKGSRQTSQSARDTLAALDVKRAQLLARGAELPELRRAAAFAAHVEKNAESRRVLDWVNSEVASYDSELASIDDAIALNDLVSKLHRSTNAQFPSWDQIDALGFKALETAIQMTPWARRFRPIAPGERRIRRRPPTVRRAEHRHPCPRLRMILPRG